MKTEHCHNLHVQNNEGQNKSMHSNGILHIRQSFVQHVFKKLQFKPQVQSKSDFPLCCSLGSRAGAVLRALASHQCVPGSIPRPGVICGLSLLLVLYSAPKGFSPGTPVFPSPQKPFPNSNSNWIIVKHFIMSLWLG